MLNDVKCRFLSLPKSATEGLEHEPQKSDFDIIRELGMGTFGTVYLVSHKKTKAKYALKAIDKTIPDNIEEKANFNREVEIMYKLNHPNIVKLYGHFEDEQYCYFIMQYIQNKSIYEVIPTPGSIPDLKLVASIMKDLLSAVYYLHNMKPTIIHRDIKPDNILLDKKYKAYLTDFGWSNYIPHFTRRTTICGTPLYLPPEMIEKKGHDETADLWCIGVVLFELVTGQTPFKGEKLETVCTNIKNLNIYWVPNMDPDAKDLVSKILKLDGKDRLPIEQMLAHPFFTKHFPNAVKELIKPEVNEIPTFVISVDDPKDYGKKQNRNNANIQMGNNTAQHSNIQIGGAETVVSNSNNNKNIHVNNTGNSNIISVNKNSSLNSKNNKLTTNSTFVPKANVDLSTIRNEKNNINDNNSSKKRKNSYIININSCFKNNVNRINTINSNKFHSNKYVINNITSYNTNTSHHINKYENNNLIHNKKSFKTQNNSNNNSINNSNKFNTINNNNKINHKIKSSFISKNNKKSHTNKSLNEIK